jgi:hypothetical protein
MIGPVRSSLRWLSAGAGLAAGAYAGYAGIAWLRYGRAPRAGADEVDPILDRLMPEYDVVERHHIRVAAPAATTFAAACDVDLQASPIVRAIFRARETILGSKPDTVVRPRGLLALTRSLGWAELASAPGREVVMGAVTQPWEANVVFHPLAPDDFVAFHEPGFVKIAWTIRADPAGETTSVFRTETRAVATDQSARARFRRYWSLLSPGIIVIRWMMLGPVKAEAERRAVAARSALPATATGDPGRCGVASRAY